MEDKMRRSNTLLIGVQQEKNSMNGKGMILKKTMAKNISELKKYLHSPNQMQILNPKQKK